MEILKIGKTNASVTWKFACIAVKSLLQTRYSGRSRLQVSGGSHPDPEIRWRLFGPQFRLKIRKWGGGGSAVPRAPPLDPPLY